MVSIVRPSRGERLSATTIRQIGFFLDPTRLSLIRTAIDRAGYRLRPLLRMPDAKSGGHGARFRLAPSDLWARRSPGHLCQLLGVGHLAGGDVAHHLAHLVE